MKARLKFGFVLIFCIQLSVSGQKIDLGFSSKIETPGLYGGQFEIIKVVNRDDLVNANHVRRNTTGK